MTSTAVSVQQAVRIVFDKKLVDMQNARASVQEKVKLESIPSQLAQLQRLEEQWSGLLRAMKAVIFNGGLRTIHGRLGLVAVDLMEESILWSLKALRNEQLATHIPARHKADLYCHSALCLTEGGKLCGAEMTQERALWVRVSQFVKALATVEEVLTLTGSTEYCPTCPEPDSELRSVLKTRWVDTDVIGPRRQAWRWSHRSWAHSMMSQLILHYLRDPPVHIAHMQTTHQHHSEQAKKVALAYMKAHDAAAAADASPSWTKFGHIRSRIVNFATLAADLHAVAFPAALKPGVYRQVQDLNKRCDCLARLTDQMEERYRRCELLSSVPGTEDMDELQCMVEILSDHLDSAIEQVEAAPIMREGAEWEYQFDAKLRDLMILPFPLPNLEEVHLALHFAEQVNRAEQQLGMGKVWEYALDVWESGNLALENYFARIAYEVAPEVVGNEDEVAGVDPRTFLLRARNFAHAGEGICATAIECAQKSARTTGEASEHWTLAADWLRRAIGQTLLAVDAMEHEEGCSCTKLRQSLPAGVMEGIATLYVKSAAVLSKLAVDSSTAPTPHQVQQLAVLREQQWCMQEPITESDLRCIDLLPFLALLQQVLKLIDTAALPLVLSQTDTSDTATKAAAADRQRMAEDVQWAVDVVVRYAAVLKRYFAALTEPHAIAAHRATLKELPEYFGIALSQIGKPQPDVYHWAYCGDVAVPHWEQVQRQGVLRRMTSEKRLVLYQLAIAEAYLDRRYEEAAMLQMGCTVIAKCTSQCGLNAEGVAYEGIAAQLTALGVPSDPPHPYPPAEHSAELQSVQAHVNHLISMLRHRSRIAATLMDQLKLSPEDKPFSGSVQDYYLQALHSYSAEADLILKVISLRLEQRLPKGHAEVATLLEEAQRQQVSAGRYLAAAKALQLGQWEVSKFWSQAAKYGSEGSGDSARDRRRVLATERCTKAAKAMSATGDTAPTTSTVHAWRRAADLTVQGLRPDNPPSSCQTEIAECWQRIAEALEQRKGSLARMWEEVMQRYEALEASGGTDIALNATKVSKDRVKLTTPGGQDFFIQTGTIHMVKKAGGDWEVGSPASEEEEEEDASLDTMVQCAQRMSLTGEADRRRIAELKATIQQRPWPVDLAVGEEHQFKPEHSSSGGGRDSGGKKGSQGGAGSNEEQRTAPSSGTGTGRQTGSGKTGRAGKK